MSKLFHHTCDCPGCNTELGFGKKEDVTFCAHHGTWIGDPVTKFFGHKCDECFKRFCDLCFGAFNNDICQMCEELAELKIAHDVNLKHD